MQVPLRIYTRDGKLMATIGDQRRIPVSYEQLPKKLVQAFLATEDDRFFQHHGIDYQGVLRAVVVDVISGDRRATAQMWIVVLALVRLRRATILHLCLAIVGIETWTA